MKRLSEHFTGGLGVSRGWDVHCGTSATRGRSAETDRLMRPGLCERKSAWPRERPLGIYPKGTHRYRVAQALLRSVCAPQRCEPCNGETRVREPSEHRCPLGRIPFSCGTVRGGWWCHGGRTTRRQAHAGRAPGGDVVTVDCVT